jgi:hypothetical protein
LNAHAKTYRFNKEETHEAAKISNEIALKVPEKLLDDTAFYSVMRKRVTKYLTEKGCRDGGPTT